MAREQWMERTVCERDEKGDVRGENGDLWVVPRYIDAQMFAPERDELVVEPGRRHQKRQVIRAERGVAQRDDVIHGGGSGHTPKRVTRGGRDRDVGMELGGGIEKLEA